MDVKRHRKALLAVGAFAVTLAGGCEASLHGTGTIFIWNGGDKPVTVQIDGRSPTEFSVAPASGKLVKDQVAGQYRVALRALEVAPRELSVDLNKDETAVVNVGAASCFARTDISGMYQSGKERVRFLEAYDQRELIVTKEVISVYPGESPPQQRTRSDYGFQRLSEVPCKMVNQPGQITEYVRSQK